VGVHERVGQTLSEALAEQLQAWHLLVVLGDAVLKTSIGDRNVNLG